MIQLVPDHPQAVKAQDHRCPQCFPHLCGSTSTGTYETPAVRLKIVRTLVIKDDIPAGRLSRRLGAGDQKRLGGVQRPEACCLIRLVSSVTWLNTLRRSAINVRIFRSACITVVWSRPPNCCPILGNDRSVSSRHRYMAICRAVTSSWVRL